MWNKQVCTKIRVCIRMRGWFGVQAGGSRQNICKLCKPIVAWWLHMASRSRSIMAWRLQAITWINVGLSSNRSSGMRLRAIRMECTRIQSASWMRKSHLWNDYHIFQGPMGYLWRHCMVRIKPLPLANQSTRCLTHWGRDKMDAISQTTFSSAFSWMKLFEFRLKFHWSLFLRV